MKPAKTTPRNIFNLDFIKSRQKLDTKLTAEKSSGKKAGKCKKSPTVAGLVLEGGKNRSPNQRNSPNPAKQAKKEEPVTKYSTSNLNEMVNRISENNKNLIYDSKHFKSNSGDAKDYVCFNLLPKNRVISKWTSNNRLTFVSQQQTVPENYPRQQWRWILQKKTWAESFRRNSQDRADPSKQMGGYAGQ